MKRFIAALALALLPLVAVAKPPVLSSAQAIALVKATPQLKIDNSVPPSDAFDKRTHPYVVLKGVPEGTVGGYLSAEYANEGTLSNGVDAVVIPLDSGGSGGVFTQIVFARTGKAPLAYAGYMNSGGHLGVKVSGGAIVATMADYGPNDPNCCPSKRIVQSYAVLGGKLHKTSEKTVPNPKPS